MKYYLSIYCCLISVFVLAQDGMQLTQTKNIAPTIEDGHIKRIAILIGNCHWDDSEIHPLTSNSASNL